MIRFIVFNDLTGVEERRGYCQQEALALQAREGETAYPLSPEEEALGLTLQQLPSGEIISYAA